MEPTPPRDIFLASLRRCSASVGFIPMFYESFLGSSDEVKQKFHLTNFDEQNRMLYESLELCAAVTSGDPEALREIHALAVAHGRDRLDIEPRFYSVWLESLIETAAAFDEQWDETIEAAWRRVLGHVVQFMIRRY